MGVSEGREPGRAHHASEEHAARRRDLAVTFVARVPRAIPDALGHLIQTDALRVVHLGARAARDQFAAVVTDETEVFVSQRRPLLAVDAVIEAGLEARRLLAPTAPAREL